MTEKKRPEEEKVENQDPVEVVELDDEDLEDAAGGARDNGGCTNIFCLS